MAIAQTLELIDKFTPKMEKITKANEMAMMMFDAVQDSVRKGESFLSKEAQQALVKTRNSLLKTGDAAESFGDDMLAAAQKAQREMDKLGDETEKAGKKAKDAEGTFGSMFKALMANSFVQGAIGAVKNFASSIWEATQVQSKSRNLLAAMIGDPAIANAMFKHIQDKARESSYGLGELTRSYQTFLSATKDVGQLDKLQNITERLAMFDTTGQGYEGATFSVKELVGGDYASIAERFNISRSLIQDMNIHNLFKNGQMDEGIAQFEKLLDMMGYTQEAAEKMSDDPMVKWNRFTSNLTTSFATAMQDIMTRISPFVDKLSEIVSSPAFQSMVSLLVSGLGLIFDGLLWVLDLAGQVYNFFAANWSTIAGILMPIATVIGIIATVALGGLIAQLAIATYQAMIYYGTMLIVKGIQLATAIASWAQAGGTWAATAAQYGLNTALWACPLVWIIALVIGLVVALIYFSDAAGFVGGVIGLLFAYMYNSIAFVWNILASFVEFFVNVWSDPVYAVKKLFADLWNNFIDMLANGIYGVETFAGDFMKTINGAINSVIGGINWLIDALNMIPGFDIGKIGLLDVDNIHAASDALKGLKMNVEKKEGMWEAPRMEFQDYGDAFGAGWDIGKGTAEAIKNGIGGIWDMVTGAGQNDTLNNMDQNISSLPDTLPGSTSNIAHVDEVNIADEDLKLLRDIAEMRFVQNFVSITPKVAMGGVTVNNNADVRSMVDEIAEGLHETLQSSASGVYTG